MRRAGLLKPQIEQRRDSHSGQGGCLAAVKSEVATSLGCPGTSSRPGQARLFRLGAGASGEAQRNPLPRSSAQAQRLALGCRRPAFVACCPRLAGAARGGPSRLQCCPGAPSCARGTLHRHPCLSAHTAPPTHVAFAHLWCAPLTQRRALRLPGACRQLPHACALVQAPS